MNKNYIAKINYKKCKIAFTYGKNYEEVGICDVSHEDIIFYLKKSRDQRDASYVFHYKTGNIILVNNEFIQKL